MSTSFQLPSGLYEPMLPWSHGHDHTASAGFQSSEFQYNVQGMQLNNNVVFILNFCQLSKIKF